MPYLKPGTAELRGLLLARVERLPRDAGPDSEGAAQAYAAAVDAARVEPVAPELARALTGMSLVQSGQGHYQDAIATAEEGRRAAVQVSAPATEARALTVLGWSLCNLGRVAEGLAHLERAQLLASAEEDIPTLLWTRGQLAAGLLASGRAAAAIDAAADVPWISAGRWGQRRRTPPTAPRPGSRR